MIQRKFCLKRMKFCSLLLMSALSFHLSIFPLMLGGKMKLQLKRKKYKSDCFSLCGSWSISRFGPGKMSSVPGSAADLIDPHFMSSPRWLGCNGSFWHLFCKMGSAISHLQMYKGEVLCPYHILLCLIGQAWCLQGSCSEHLMQGVGSRLPSWRWIRQLEHFQFICFKSMWPLKRMQKLCSKLVNLFFPVLSLVSHLQGRLEDRHLVIWFSSLAGLFRICQTRVPMY